jgi:glycosyltransferase involved in cell wall biosynthesis
VTASACAPRSDERAQAVRASTGSDYINGALGWPARFRSLHGRAPRVLHICNIANYAWVNATIMRRRGVDCVVLDPDFYHVVSSPEWLESDFDGDYGDDYYPRWRDVNLHGYQRPEWFINGPSPFVLSELAARERGDRLSRRAYRALSDMYRSGLGAKSGCVSPMRRAMESEHPALVKLKRALRRVLLSSAQYPAASRAAVEHVQEGGGTANAALLPRGVSRRLLDSAFAPFDVIVGYGLGARFPLGAGFPHFVSLELGTLRGLPFEDSELGRLARLVYLNSPEVFVTNVDCLEPALRVGIPQARLTAIPHPFDLETARSYARSPTQSPISGPDPYFFCPARHHWRKGNASWLKGNDVLIRGAAEAASLGYRFRLVMVEWGQELDLSRSLIDELGLTDRVVWLRPMHRRAMWSVLAGAEGVIDQFGAPAFGGIGLEAMAFGKPLISRIEGAQLTAFFQTNPPMLEASTPAQVARRIAQVLTNPAMRSAVGRAGQQWMQSEHNEDRQLDLQFEVFERLLGTSSG